MLLGGFKTFPLTSACSLKSSMQKAKASIGLVFNSQQWQQQPTIVNSFGTKKIFCAYSEKQTYVSKAWNISSSLLPSSSSLDRFSVSSFGIQNRQYSESMSDEKKPKSSFEQHEVVPDVIATVPKEILEVCFCEVRAKEGNCLTPTEVQDQPELSWMAQADAFYTICMTDPDAPSREDPQFREWHHWLVVNVPNYYVKKGKVLSAYIGAGPPKDTGLHRYVLLVYKQKCKLEFDEPELTDTSADGRGGFKIADFAKKYDLGEPIAGNFFQAEWDDYVPQLYEKLGLAEKKEEKPQAKPKGRRSSATSKK